VADAAQRAVNEDGVAGMEPEAFKVCGEVLLVECGHGRREYTVPCMGCLQGLMGGVPMGRFGICS